MRRWLVARKPSGLAATGVADCSVCCQRCNRALYRSFIGSDRRFAPPTEVLSPAGLRRKCGVILMRCFTRPGLAIAVSLSILVAPRCGAAEPRVDIQYSRAGMVVSDSAVASAVGRDVLARGGNAVDASVAVAFALCVTWPEAGNIGGGGFMMVAPDDAEVVCIEYRETAPAAATATSFVDWTMRRHPKMAGVPGTVRGLETAHREFGELPWHDLVQPAVQLAEEGFVIDRHLADSLNGVLHREMVQSEPRFAELRRVFGKPDGSAWEAGDVLQQPELAATLQRIADDGADAFYHGPIAEAIVRLMQSGDGLISKEDLAEYEARVREPIRGEVFGHTVYGAPLPSSGGITVLLQLRILESLGIGRAGGRWTGDDVHLMVEAARRAFRERAAHLGDADFVEIPDQLTTTAFADQLAGSIDPQQATPSASIAGEISLAEGAAESHQTTHFSVVDAQGMAVSNTYTLEQSFGSYMVVPGAGFLLNNEMGDFNWNPGITDAKGAIGTPANRIAPGKRMLSSQSPTIVRRDGDVVLVVGSPGGRTIINTVTQIVLGVVAYERSLPEAVDAMRFHHQWFPDRVALEENGRGVEPSLQSRLERLGHKVQRGGRQGSAHSIAVDPATGVMTGVADWRRGGRAVGLVMPRPVTQKADR